MTIKHAVGAYRKLKFLSLIVLMVCLTGCGAVNQQMALRESEQLKQQMLDRLEADPLVSRIRDKLWLGEINEAPLRYFVNKSMVEESDKPSLERGHQIGQENGRDAAAFFRKYIPLHLSIFEAHGAASFSLFVQLYEKKISYGEYHVKRKDITSRFREALSERDRELALRQSENQNQASNNFFNFLLAQSLINSQRQPTVVAPQNITYEIYAPPPVRFQRLPMPGMTR